MTVIHAHIWSIQNEDPISLKWSIKLDEIHTKEMSTTAQRNVWLFKMANDLNVDQVAM